MRTSQRIRKLLEVKILDGWTRNFCESLLEQIVKGRLLSARQVEILDQKEKVFSNERLQEEDSWTSSWDEEKQEIFRVCAMYYRKTGYFGNIAQMVGSDGTIADGYIPTKRAYNKMCNNKYATKIREAWFAEPKYPVGSVVAVRSTAPNYSDGQAIRKHNQGSVMPHFVIETNSKHPESACKGAKLYKIVSAGSAVPFDLEERHLKTLRKTKRK
jgi:hypothetical protein